MSTTDIWQQLQALNQRAVAGEEIYEDAISIGQAVIEDEDKGAIAIGVLAAALMKAYNKNQVGKFADSIGIGRSTAYKRAQVVRFYGADMLRDRLVDNRSVLSFSHFYHAMEAGNIVHSRDFLNKWEDNTTTPGTAANEIKQWHKKPLPPKTIIDAATVCLTRVDYAAGIAVFQVDGLAEDLQLYTGQQVVMTIKESERTA